ncbi:unnamed protein product, partial [Ixodes persulcatus]
ERGFLSEQDGFQSNTGATVDGPRRVCPGFGDPPSPHREPGERPLRATCVCSRSYRHRHLLQRPLHAPGGATVSS